MRLPRLQAPLLLVLVAALALPAAASANDFQTVYREYKRTGTIKPCRFSDGTLRNAERQTPPDVEQYAPSFLDALQSAREHGADCGKKAAAPPAAPSGGQPTPSSPTPVPEPTTTTPAVTPQSAAPPAPTVPAQANVTGVASPAAANAKAEKDDSAPAAVWLLAALGALILISALFAGLAWWFGWSAERFTRPWRASWSEFGGRVADFRGEFGDWIRTGN